MKKYRGICKRVLAAVSAALILVTGMPAEVHAATADLVGDIEQADIKGIAAGIAGDIKDSVYEKISDAFSAAPKAREYDEETAEVIEHDKSFYELQYENTGDGYRVTKFVLKNGTAPIDGETFMGFIEIPDEYEGLPVTSIGSNAFSALNKLSYMDGGWAYVFLPSSIKSFENSAFANLKPCMTIDFGTDPQLSTIGDYAFSNSEVWLDHIPSNVTSIGSYAFSNTRFSGNLGPDNPLVFPASLISIGDHAFENCDGLWKVTFEENSALESIGESAFAGAFLQEFQYPSSAPVSRIEDYTFADSSVETVSLPSKLGYIGRYAFSQSDIGSLIITNDLPDNGAHIKGLTIEEGAFKDCDRLETIVLPDYVEKIGRDAFNSSSLSNVLSYSDYNSQLFDSENENSDSYSISIGILGLGAFSMTQVKKLKLGTIGSIDDDGGLIISPLPDYLEELIFNGQDIPQYLCYELGFLKKVKISSNTDYVGANAFYHCADLIEVEIAEDEDDVEDDNHGISIGDSAFEDCSALEEINFPKVIYSIGEKAFYNCEKLGLPELPDTITAIGSDAFTGTLDFSVNKLPSKLVRVGDRVFEGCTALMQTSLPATIQSVGESAFADIPFEELVIPASLNEIGQNAFSGAKKIIFADGTKEIPDNACYGCEALKTVEIPGTVTTVGEAAFHSCKSLTAISLPDSITSIKEDAFNGCSSITSVKIPNSITELPFRAFSGCSQLKKVTLPNGLIIIGSAAFSGCKSLTGIKLPGTLMEINDSAFFGCSSLSDIVIPERVNKLGFNAFSGTDILVVEIPKNVRTITRWHDAAFDYWTPFNNVRKMIFADGTTTIHSGIAYKATALEEIVIPKSVTKISINAFYNCRMLTDIYYEGTKDEWESIAKYNNASEFSNATVHFESEDSGNDAVTGVVIKPGSAILGLSEKKRLCAEVLPKTAKNKYVTWSSKDTDIAVVDNKGVVTPKGYGKTQIICRTNDGWYEAACDIEVTNNIPVLNDFKLTGGAGSFAVDEDVPFFGGKEFSLDLPVDLPVNFVLEDNKIKIGINIAKKNLYSADTTEGVNTSTYKKKSIKEQFEDFKYDAMKADLLARDVDWLKNVQDKAFMKANFPGVEGKASFNAVGYLEAHWTGDNKVQKVQGTVIFTFSASETATTIFAWTVPVTVMCTISANGQVTADIGYNFEEAEFYGDIELLAKFGIEIYGGVGVGDWLSLGVYGSANSTVKIALHANSSVEESGLEEWSVGGEAGLKAYFAKKSASIKIIEGKQYIYPEEKNHKSIADYDQLELTENAIDNKLIVKNLAATEAIQNNVVDATGILVQDAYNAAKPVISSTSTDQILFYVTDDASRSLLNQSQLVYSIYDPVNNTYSDAKPVLPGNNTADYEPEVFTDGADVYVAWLDSDKLFTDEDALKDDADSLDAYVKSFRVHVARYDYIRGGFEDLGGPAESLKFSSSPRLFMDDGKLQLAFVENKNDSMVYDTKPNTSVYWAEYSDGIWSVRDEVSGLNSVSSIGFAEDENGVYLGYVVEKDTDPKTEGQELFLRKNSASIKVDEGEFTNLSYTELPAVSGKVMAVNARGALKYIDGTSLTELLPEGTMNASSRFFAEGNRVLYIVSGEESRSIAASTYDSGEWGQALLTHEEKGAYIDFMSVDSGTICYLYSDVVSAGDGTFDATSSIRILPTDDYNDTELELVDFALNDAYPGATLPVSLYIKNNGTAKVDKAHVSVTYDGTEVTSADLDVSLMPGETKEYPFEFLIPEKLSAGAVEVTVSTAGDEVPANDTKEIAFSMADLEVISSYDDSEETPVINIMVENRGLKATNMEMTVTDEEGKVLFTESGRVRAGNFLSFEEDYTLEKKQILTIEVNGDEEEFYTMNNITWQEVGKEKADPGPEPEAEDAFSVKFADIAADPYEGLFFNKDAGAKGRYETVYTGAAIKPAVVVYGYNKKLSEGTDYTVKYSGNTAVSSKKPATVTITGIGNFAGKTTLEFYILPADLSELKDRSLLTLPEEIKLQSGKKISPVIIYGDYTLKSSDMTLSNTGVIKEDTAIDITGKGNFTGTLSDISVTVLDAKAIKAATIKVAVKAEKHVYDGTEQKLTCTYLDDEAGTVKGEITVTAGSSKEPLIEDEDYKVIYKKGTNVQAGKVRFTVVGIGDYTGSVSKTFKIEPDKTSAITANLSDTESEVLYSSLGASPEVKVIVTRQGQEPLELVSGKDYKISYSNNKKVGTGKYTVSFIGNYKGHKAIKNRTFTIKQASFAAAKAISGDLIYTKAGKYLSKPMVTVDNALVSAKDYEVTYFDGDAVLTSKSKLTLEEGVTSKEITVKVKGKGNYLGDEVTASYRVIKPGAGMQDLSKAKIVAVDKVKGKDVSVGKQEYTGVQVRPEIRVLVKDEKGWTEVEKSSYTVEYVNNVNIGSATILITGDGETAVGSKSCKFSIGTKSLNIFSILFGKKS